MPATDPAVRQAAVAPLPARTVPATDSAYWAFYEAVTARQLERWAPAAPGHILDLSGGRAHLVAQLVDAGHLVLQPHATRPGSGPTPGPAAGYATAVRQPEAEGEAEAQAEAEGPTASPEVGLNGSPQPGALLPVVAPAFSLCWLRDRSLHAVLAEARALPLATAPESALADLRRVLRPGGTLLLVVESLVLGLSRLAEQGQWAVLADVAHSGTLVVPDDLGACTRFFRAAELAAMLGGAGFDVEWVRPRTVLTPTTIERAMSQQVPLATLVNTEAALSEQGDADSTGLHLVACARRPSWG